MFYIKLCLCYCPVSLTSYFFFTDEVVLSSTVRPPPLSKCPQGLLGTHPLTFTASNPPCRTYWLHKPNLVRSISARSLQPNPCSAFSEPKEGGHINERKHKRRLFQRPLLVTLTQERSSGWTFAAPGFQQKLNLLPESLCMNPAPRATKMSSQRANSIARCPGGSDHLLGKGCPLECRMDVVF